MLITTIFRSFVFLCILAGSSQALPLLGADNLIKEMKGKLFSGKGTFYEVGPGSCGQSNSNAAKVVALNLAQMGNNPNPNKNSHCGQTVSITGDNGATTAEVVDTCPSCPSGALDMSPAVFEQVCGSLDIGSCKISWNFA